MNMSKNPMISHDSGHPEALGEAGTISSLTPRQLEVIALIADGNSNKQVGKLLSISANAVKRHVYRSCQKLALTNRTQLIVAFVKWQMREEREQ